MRRSLPAEPENAAFQEATRFTSSAIHEASCLRAPRTTATIIDEQAGRLVSLCYEDWFRLRGLLLCGLFGPPKQFWLGLAVVFDTKAGRSLVAWRACGHMTAMEARRQFCAAVYALPGYAPAKKEERVDGWHSVVSTFAPALVQCLSCLRLPPDFGAGAWSSSAARYSASASPMAASDGAARKRLMGDSTDGSMGGSTGEMRTGASSALHSIRSVVVDGFTAAAAALGLRPSTSPVGPELRTEEALAEAHSFSPPAADRSVEASGSLESFVGVWQHVRTEGIDGYLKHMGVNSFSRALVRSVSPAPAITLVDGRLCITHETTLGRRIEWLNPHADETDTDPQGRSFAKRVEWRSARLVSTFRSVDPPSSHLALKDDIVTQRWVDAQGNLHQITTYDGVSFSRLFSQQAPLH